MTDLAPRIGIIGAGAIGGFYGLMLARAGYEVHFLMRSDYEAVREHGLSLKSSDFGDFQLTDTQVYRDVAQMPACDVLLVAAKTTSNQALAPLIAQAAAHGATVLLLQNGLGVEDEMRAHLPAHLHLLGGLCMVSVHRRGAGLIEHCGFGSINIGYHSGADGEEAQQVLRHTLGLFAKAGIDAPMMGDLAHARWQKLVMNIPFNGLSVVLDSGTLAMRAQPEVRDLLLELMNEVVAGAAACGHSLGEDFVDKAWSATDGNADFHPSMYLDYKAGRALELHAIYEAPLRAAREAGYRMVKIEMLHQTLCFLDQRNRVFAH